MTAAVPVPHGERSTSASAKIVTLRRSADSFDGRPREDRAVDTVEQRLQRMRDRHRLLDGVLDLHPEPPEVGQPLRRDRDPRGLAVDDGVEGAAVGDVGAELAASGADRDGRVQDERRHVPEAARS